MNSRLIGCASQNGSLVAKSLDHWFPSNCHSWPLVIDPSRYVQFCQFEGMLYLILLIYL